MAEHTKYQQNIIRNYYQNAEAISLQKLSEYVSDLYLAEGKGREKVWKNITAALERLKIPAPRIAHLKKENKPELVAKLVEELMAKKN